METIITYSSSETQEVASRIGQKIKNGGIVLLIGDLGSGKTTFVQGLAHGLKINQFKVKSPTFTYIREYPQKHHHIYHLDLYRLSNHQDLIFSEIDEIFQNPDNIVIVEWADRLPERNTKCFEVKLEYLDTNRRKITITEK